MPSNPTSLERAFELAKSGRFASIGEIKQQLKTEGFSLSQLVGPSLMKQLSALLRTAATQN
jgi:hypothetical protein